MLRMTRLLAGATVAGALAVASVGFAATADATPVPTPEWADLKAGTIVTAMAATDPGVVYTVSSKTGAVTKITDGVADSTWGSAGSMVSPQDMIALPDGTVVTANGKAGTLTHFDTDGNAVSIKLEVSAEAQSLAYLDGFVYVADYANKLISKVDPVANAVTEASFAKVSASPIRITTDGTSLYVQNGQEISKIEKDKSTAQSFIALPMGSLIGSIVATSTGSVVAADGNDPPGLIVYSSDGKTSKKITTTTYVNGLAIDSHDNVYGSYTNSNQVVMLPFGSSSLSTLTTLVSKNAVKPVAISVSDNGVLYTAGYETGLVSAVPLLATISSAPLSASVPVDTFFTSTITTVGGADPVTLRATALPPGMELSGGVLSGRPTTPGTYTFDIVAVTPAGESAAQAQTIVVTPAVAPPTPGPTSSNGGSSNTGATGSGGSGRATLASTGADIAPLGLAAGLFLLGAAITLGALVKRRDA
ncbi:hypothetical protein NY547_19265 [Cnuibacter physcomitrellae]|uniref:hypothetical protein n=1 Tax=Cnuibacter physcomitrellae TaxID=1619308 RepID=UPI002175E875|nr:hypothetical protein [Cnuibacter physcomitrellae]MCS5499387.1 hypothetical protein [Cnuibacter physcomitrellae]